MQACLVYYLGSNVTFTKASMWAAIGQKRGGAYTWSIRGWIHVYIDKGDLPIDWYGWWNVPALEDEDITAEIRLHCLHVGKYITAVHIVEFLNDPDVHKRLGLRRSISVRTAERWLHRSGYKWGREPKGQYYDGHEREDVVAYRQTKYIPAWKELESRMVSYTQDGLTLDPEQLLVLRAGEKQVIVWFHDESTFYAHDCQLQRWVFIGEHPIPAQKGEGNSVMIADYVSKEQGWLRGKNG
ncbi:hypothetical protein FRC06_009142, partial [Ceratobasidium sp. 370]